MRKIITICLTMYLALTCANAQSVKETFDSNSLNWNECAIESDAGTSIIDKGVLTITSKGVNKFWSAMIDKQVGANTYFTCCCYAPLNVQHAFKILTNVTIEKLDDDKLAGLIFNYKDDGTFYAFVFNETTVRFLRYVDYKLVGSISQSIKWGKTKKVKQEWYLESDNSTITFTVNGLQIMKVRYMPLNYTGFGYYTYGKQKLIVDDVEFIQ